MAKTPNLENIVNNQFEEMAVSFAYAKSEAERNEAVKAFSDFLAKNVFSEEMDEVKALIKNRLKEDDFVYGSEFISLEELKKLEDKIYPNLNLDNIVNNQFEETAVSVAYAKSEAEKKKAVEAFSDFLAKNVPAEKMDEVKALIENRLKEDDFVYGSEFISLEELRALWDAQNKENAEKKEADNVKTEENKLETHKEKRLVPNMLMVARDNREAGANRVPAELITELNSINPTEYGLDAARLKKMALAIKQSYKELSNQDVLDSFASEEFKEIYANVQSMPKQERDRLLGTKGFNTLKNKVNGEENTFGQDRLLALYMLSEARKYPTTKYSLNNVVENEADIKVADFIAKNVYGYDDPVNPTSNGVKEPYFTREVEIDVAGEASAENTAKAKTSVEKPNNPNHPNSGNTGVSAEKARNVKTAKQNKGTAEQKTQKTTATAENFDGLTAEKLHDIVNGADFADMDVKTLNALRKAAKAANLQDTFDGDKISIQINNKTYNDIKNSDDYTAEEKAMAKDARDEYNNEIRQRRAAEILKSARKVDGKYIFESLVREEYDLLEKVGLRGQFSVDKDVYQIGQVKDKELAQILQALKANAEKRETSQAAAKVQDKVQASAPVTVNEDGSVTMKANQNQKPVESKTAEPSMPADLQKSYDFWNKFNENSEKTGVKFQIDNIENKHLLVEAKKGDKTLFKGIDHGSKGFDIVKRDKNADAYEVFDLLVKKAKARNPKTVIRIKDNVTDEVLRNKILIACAKNNMKPVGNLPEGFDFEELKEAVKNLKSAEEINAFAEEMAAAPEYSFGQEQEKDKEKRRTPVAPVIVNKDKEERRTPVAPVIINKDKEERRTPVAPVIVNKDKEERRTPIAPVAGNSNNGGNGNNGGNRTPVVPVAQAPKEKWWKKAWRKSRNWILGGALVAASLFGVKSCQQGEKLDKAKADIENLQGINKDLLNQNKELQEDINDLTVALDDCGKSKQPEVKKPVVKTPVKKKTVKKKPGKVTPNVIPETKPDTVEVKPNTPDVLVDTVPNTPVVLVDTVPNTPVVPVDTVQPKQPQSVVGMKEKNHEPLGTTSESTETDIKDAENGVVDFRRWHGSFDDLSSDPMRNANNASDKREVKEKSAKDKKDNTAPFFDFYTAIHNKQR